MFIEQIRAFSERIDGYSLGGKCSKFLFIEQIHANGCWLKAINLIAICSSEWRGPELTTNNIKFHTGVLDSRNAIGVKPETSVRRRPDAINQREKNGRRQ